MKLHAQLAPLLCALTATAAHAASLVVPPAGFDSINLDIDGDTYFEISQFWTTPGPPAEISVGISFELPAEFLLPGGFASPPSVFPVQSFATLADLMDADIYSGIATLTMASQDGSAVTDVAGFQSFDLSTPVMAAFIWGTLGRGTNPPDDTLHYLAGWVIDASDYVLDDTQPITIYYHNYGPFPEGHSAHVSLAATGVPEPQGMLLLGLLIPALRRRRCCC